MAHKKGQGSVRNGRDSSPKRLGLKVGCGQYVTTGSMIIMQRGTKFIAGRGVKRAKDDAIFAMIDGVVSFDRQGRRVNVTAPVPVAAVAH